MGRIHKEMWKLCNIRTEDLNGDPEKSGIMIISKNYYVCNSYSTVQNPSR